MTLEMFLYFFTLGSAFSSLFTQALKKSAKNLSSNALALVSSAFVGIGGGLSYYVIMDIPITFKDVIATVLLALCLWIGSMCSYDKIRQLLSQLRG